MVSLNFILLPLLGCILIVLINVYFGIHVIKREIIFIDIALASIAALGSAVAMVIMDIGHDEAAHGEDAFWPYLFSLGFISIASLAFTLLRNRTISISLEAIIGIAYAVATTLTVIILDKGAGGDVHVHDMLVGTILWVSGPQLARLAVVVVITGAFHIVFRKKLLALTESFHEQEPGIKRPGLWGFLFYFSFGLVVVEAVKIAGILTVFAFLILPASLAVILKGNWTTKLIVGWLSGIAASFAGLMFSLRLDVPSAPVIITVLGIILLLGYLFSKLADRRKAAK
ncbi:MAG: metal ABC transporter permease [Bacteroidales bacterium]|jgi:zinc/manganese transport system permease protein|nr:metal ABC transporter permease [Bacteroidales bacterium]